MIYYAALDVSLRSVSICVIDEQGEIRAEAKLASEVEDIAAYLNDLDLNIVSVGLEAGTLTQCLTYGLQAAGYEAVCTEARQVKAALSAMRNKTDKKDARGIAQILRSGCLPPVPTAKRSVTHAKTRPIPCHKTWELDMHARLEKRTFTAVMGDGYQP